MLRILITSSAGCTGRTSPSSGYRGPSSTRSTASMSSSSGRPRRRTRSCPPGRPRRARGRCRRWPRPASHRGLDLVGGDVVDACERERHRAVVGARPLDLAGQRLDEEAAVPETGVVVAALEQSGLGARGRQLVGERPGTTVLTHGEQGGRDQGSHREDQYGEGDREAHKGVLSLSPRNAARQAGGAARACAGCRCRRAARAAARPRTRRSERHQRGDPAPQPCRR